MLRLALRRARIKYTPCRADCGGVAPRAGLYRDRSFADGQVSPDQARIAAALPSLLTPTTRILHVGVGCSDLAVRFAGRVARIDGITLLRDELEVAERLGIPNYDVHLLDKYAAELPTRLPGPYDLVVDNNPGTYACCVKHFRVMTASYARQLAPGGRVVTEERGATWRQLGGMTLPWEVWVREGAAVGLVAERIAGTVWGWRG